MAPVYCTREDVMSALDAAEGARSVGQIDRLIDRGSRAVESLCHRRFYPETATRYLDWPNDQLGTAYRVYLDGEHELISATAITGGGVDIGDYFLEPQASGPPYTRLEVNLGGGGAFSSAATVQRSLAITGVFGACNDFDTAVNTSTLALEDDDTTVTLGTGRPVGVGALIRVGTELLQVTAKTLASTTVTIAADLTSNPGSTAVTVASAAELNIPVGETITVGTERMLVTDRYTATLMVERQWSGSVLAAHSSGATIYAPRTLTVRRGQLGTTAAAADAAATIDLFTPPALVRDLTIAEAIVGLAREQSGYARTVGSGRGGTRGTTSADDITDLRTQCYAAHGRKARLGAI